MLDAIVTEAAVGNKQVWVVDDTPKGSAIQGSRASQVGLNGF